MARGSIKKNFILSVSNQLMNILAPLITTPYVSRVLGVEGIGRYSYLESITSYFVLFAILGTATYAQREISYVQDNEYERSKVFYSTLILRCMTTTIMLVAYFFVFHDDVLLKIFAVNILTVAMDITWFFQGMEDFGKIMLKNMVFRVLSIIYTFLFIRAEEDLLIYAAGMVSLNLLGAISMWSNIARYVEKPRLSFIRPFKDINTILSLFIPTIAIQIYTIFDKTMLGLFTATSYENGCYEQAMKVVRAIQVIVSAVGTVMAPRIGYYFARSDSEKVREYMLKSYKFVWFISIPLSFGIIGISDNMVPWFFGQGYDKDRILLKILPVLAVIIGMSNVTGIQYLVPTKRQNILTKTVVAGAIVNFCLNLLLIPNFYSVGAAAASVVAEMTISILQFRYVRKEIDIKSAVLSGTNYAAAGMIMLCVLRFASKSLDSSIKNTLCLIAIGVIAYVIFLIMLRDKYFFDNMKQLAKKFNNEKK